MIKIDLALPDFQKYMEQKRCICFGAGLQGIRFINIFGSWGKSRDIIAFIDNDIFRQGKKFGYGEYSYQILSLSNALPLFQEDVVIVITCADILKIRNQLDEYQELDLTICFSLIEIAQKQLIVSDYDRIIHEYNKPIIPKKIHYCWFGGKLPDSLKKNIENWKQMCPEYEIIEWNELNCDLAKNRYVNEAYKMKKWAYVSDYIRLDVLYQHGGIYLDTDVEIVRNLDDLLYQDGFASFDGSLLVNTGAGIGAKAKGNIVKELRDYYEEIKFRMPDGQYNKISCMTFTYDVLKKHGMMVNDTMQKIGDINIYPMIFQGTCCYTQKLRITNKTYFLHYGTNLWLDKKNNEIRDSLRKAFEKEFHEGVESYSLGREL